LHADVVAIDLDRTYAEKMGVTEMCELAVVDLDRGLRRRVRHTP